VQPAGQAIQGQHLQPKGGQQFIRSVQPAGMVWETAQPVALSRPESGLQMARPSRPWRMYGRVIGLVILAFFFIMSVAEGLILALEYDDALIGSFCMAVAIPFMLGLVAMRRPRVILLERAVPDPQGQLIHPITAHAGSLRTPVPTRMGRHLIRDDSILDVPTSRASWLLFTLTVVVAFALGALIEFGGTGGVIIALILILPTIIIGFSIPVMAWWSHSTKRIGLPTRRRDAEAWLMAGIFAGLPAIMINSWVFPHLVLNLNPDISDIAFEFLIYAVSAPVGEEVCKGLAIWFFASRIRSPRHGFQIGFTVGLGFAIVENLMYVAGSGAGGLTILVRGIGSIPGHAVWTSLTGVGIGWYLMRQRAALLHAAARSGERITEPESSTSDWKLFDSKTGLEIDPAGQAPASGVQVSPSGVRIWTPAPVIHPDKGWFRLPLPQTPLLGLVLAIAGHSFWNGSLTAVAYWSDSKGMGDFELFLIMLVWISILVCTVLLVASGLLASIREAPDGSELDAYQSDLAAITRHR
jgi:RsiW-degrading membrane proteinase PrsW (M82 family)